MKLQIGIDGNTYEVEVEITEDDEAPRYPSSGPYSMVPATVHAAPAPAAPPKSPAPGAATGDEDKLCRSPIAGIVIRTNVAPGQKIAENDSIMVIVKSVKVAPGEPVKAQQVLIEFE